MANYSSVGTQLKSALAFNTQPQYFKDRQGYGDLYWFYSAAQPAINYINNARIVRADNLADNGVYHVISRPLYPPGITNTLDTYLKSNASLSKIYSLWQALLKLDPSVQDAYSLYDPGMHATVFIPADNAWSDVPDVTFTSLQKNGTFLRYVLMSHFALQQIAFPQWILETNQSISLNMKFGYESGILANMMYNGNFYITAGGVTAQILDPAGTPLTQCVVYRIDRPLGFIYQTKVSWLKKYANSFLTSCQNDVTCLAMLQTPQTTVIAIADSGIADWNALLANSSMKNTTLSMHFLGDNQPLSIRSSGDLLTPLTGSAIIRYRRDATSGEFIDARVAGRGFLFAKILYKDLVGTDGNAIVVGNALCCSPQRTISDILADTNSMGGRYSYFLSNWTNTFFKFADTVGYLTLFIPSNAAMDGFANQATQIFSNASKRLTILQRHLIVNNVSVGDLLPSSQALYKAATANYRDLKEYVFLKLVDSKSAIISYGNKSVTVNLGQGGLSATNGYIYPIDDVLYVNTD